MNPGADMSTWNPIIVGVDGSPSSVRALWWALRQAGLVGAPVEAVIAWQDPAIYGIGFEWASVSFDSESLAEAAEKVLADSVAQVTVAGQGGGPPVQVVPRVVQGHPAQVLLEAARGAQLLVMGSRGARHPGRGVAWFGQPALCATCALPGAGGAGRAATVPGHGIGHGTGHGRLNHRAIGPSRHSRAATHRIRGPVVSSIQRLMARAVNTMVRWASIESR